MKFLSLVTVFAALVPALAAAQQGPDTQAFDELRERVIKSARGKQLDARVATFFGLPQDVKIVEGATLRLPVPNGERALSLAFSTSTADVMFVESRELRTGTAIAIFHAEHPSLNLRAAAAGATHADLKRVPPDRARVAYRELLTVWARVLPQLLKQNK